MKTIHSLIHKYPPLSKARYSFTQVSELEQHGANKFVQGATRQHRIQTHVLSSDGQTHYATGLHTVASKSLTLSWYFIKHAASECITLLWDNGLLHGWNKERTFHPMFSKKLHRRAWPVVFPPHGPVQQTVALTLAGLNHIKQCPMHTRR